MPSANHLTRCGLEAIAFTGRGLEAIALINRSSTAQQPLSKTVR
ncbi:MAG: hypothetical protein WA947_15625 [Phormidesmis sp.]